MKCIQTTNGPFKGQQNDKRDHDHMCRGMGSKMHQTSHTYNNKMQDDKD